MFRAEEFKQFCVHFDIEEGVRHQLEDFYNGFEFKIDGKNESFYNNCSIVNYLAQKAPREIQSFRFLKGNIIAPIKDLFEKPVIIEALYDLVASGERYFLKPQQFDLAMYRRLRTAVAKKKAKDIKEEDKKDVLHLLYHLGYLTRSLSTDDGDSESGPSSSKDVLVAIPNGEVCEAFQGILGNEFGE
jgi:hypothetical protein